MQDRSIKLDDDCFRDFQDKVESRCGVRPLDKKEALKKKYKNPRNDLKERLLRTIIMRDQAKKSMNIDLDEESLSNEEELNGCSNETEIFWPCETTLDHAAKVVFKAYEEQKKNHPDRYNDDDFMMDFFNKVSDRLS